MGFFKICCNIKVFVVPKHFGPGIIKRPGFLRALNVKEILCPGSLLPGRLIQQAIHHDGLRGFITDILPGNNGYRRFLGKTNQYESEGKKQGQKAHINWIYMNFTDANRNKNCGV
jgi:hypothetical protein